MDDSQIPPERQEAKFKFMAPVSATNQIIGDHGNMLVNQGNESKVDVAALRSNLEQLYDQLGEMGLNKKQQRDAQTAVNLATKAVEHPDAKGETTMQQIQLISENFKEAGISIQNGSQVASTILNIANIVAPLVVGGAKVVAGMFGVPL